MGITYKTYSDNQLSFALKDVNETIKLHPEGSIYYDKLQAERDKIIEVMSDRCVKECNKRYTNNHNKKYIQNNW
jgi:hypothetical protein